MINGNEKQEALFELVKEMRKFLIRYNKVFEMFLKDKGINMEDINKDDDNN